MGEIVQQPALGDIIIEGGVPSMQFYTWLDQVTKAVNNIEPLTGFGSPESIIIASAGRWYVDKGSAAGEGIYFKQSGDGSAGWVLRS